MKGWLTKNQVSELKIGQWNRKNRKRQKKLKTLDVTFSKTEQYAKHMRENPTPSEQRLLTAMRKVRYENGWVVSPQVVLGPYITDIFIPNRKVVVEVDGSSHIGREEYDSRRESFLWNSGFIVVRVTNAEVWGDLNDCVERIKCFVDKYGKKFKGWRKKNVRNGNQIL